MLVPRHTRIPDAPGDELQDECPETRQELLLALTPGAAFAMAAGIRRALGAPAAMHVEVTGKDYASQQSVRPWPDVSGVLDRRSEVWGGRQETYDL